MFAHELEHVRKTYLANRSDPPIPRNMPPLSGRVAWARNLSRRLDVPVNVLHKLCPQMFQEDCNKRLIRNYNKVASTMVKFEQV